MTAAITRQGQYELGVEAEGERGPYKVETRGYMYAVATHAGQEVEDQPTLFERRYRSLLLRVLVLSCALTPDGDGFRSPPMSRDESEARRLAASMTDNQKFVGSIRLR